MLIVWSDPGPEVQTEEEEEEEEDIIIAAGETDRITETGDGRTGPETMRAR